MKKVLSIFFALLLIVSMATVVNAEDTKLKVKSITFPTNADVSEAPRGGTTALLIDGDPTTATAHSTNGVVLYMNKKATSAGVYTEFDLVLELEEAAVVGGLIVDFYTEYNSMVGFPKDNTIKIEKSNDGSAYVPAGEVSFEGTLAATDKGVVNKVLPFDEAFEAKFIKLTFAYGDSPFTTDGKVIWEWVGFTEIAVTEGALSEESEAPAESEEPVEESETPDTGDYGYVSFIVIAAVSLAGAVVVSRRKRS